jgi:hybrid cluster-associated redox disulfide protein
MKITKKTDMHELLMNKPEIAGILFQSGMGCVGCPMSMSETLEEGCKAHGMNNKEIEKLIEKLNGKKEIKTKIKKKIGRKKK